ncbi:aspartate racemase [Methanolacinia petrolearia DSM 11571]|uniref:Aspartate racemase n=1 Tax=Methanolacinia petrolearia (strain DSM 11571 / OCM 486 / SEBR 4847) TaxID=679926 RepID=E1RGK4_METP4|nr:amino acid racemase [Methanolacinia petrolearia]ADN35215.1 aspartate racemase [Methanolacinia petrolearia DSM 11571]
MKMIGVIGGMSRVSSAEYYKLMNEMVEERPGGLHSAKILMYSIEFAEFTDIPRRFRKVQSSFDWKPLRNTMIDSAERLKRGGAYFIIRCSNTLHSSADDIEKKVKIPVLHIAGATGEKIRERALKIVGLPGTEYTMEEDFYRKRLEEKFGIKVIILVCTEIPLLVKQKDVEIPLFDMMTIHAEAAVKYALGDE